MKEAAGNIYTSEAGPAQSYAALVALWERAQEAASWSDAEHGRAYLLFYLTDLAGDLGLAEEAEWFELGLSQARDLEQRGLEARLQEARARGQAERGDLAGARERLSAALSILQASDRNFPFVALSAAEFAMVEEDWGLARSLLDQAHACLEQEFPDDAVQLGMHAGREAEFALGIGRPDRAQAWIEREEAAAMATGNLDLLVASWLHDAESLIAMGEYEALVESLGEQLDKPYLRERDVAQLSVRLGLGQKVLELLDPQRTKLARDTLLGALESGHLQAGHLRSALFSLAELALDAGEWERVEELLRRVEDSRAPGASAFGSVLVETQWASIRARLVLARKAPGELPVAHVYAERAAQRLISEWRAAPALPGGSGFLQYSTRRQIFGLLVDLELSAGADHAALERALEVVNRSSQQGSLCQSLPALDPAAPGLLVGLRTELLAPGRGALLLLPSRFSSHLFAIDQESVVHVRLPDDRVLDTARKRLVEQVMRAAELDLVIPDARAVADLMLPPSVRAQLAGWDEVYIIGTEALGYLPMELLDLGEGRTLGTEHAVASLPSVEVGRRLAARRRAQDTSEKFGVALFAVPDPGPLTRERWKALEPLPFGADQLGQWQASYGAELVAQVGDAATVQALRRAPLATARMLSFVGHGVMDPERDLPACLAFRESTEETMLFDCEGVASLHAVPPLVTLTACGAGRAPRRWGEDGSEHLGGAFLRRGASCVLLAHLPLGFQDAMALDATLHRELAAGRSAAQALRQARRACASPAAMARSLVHCTGLGFEPQPRVQGAQATRLGREAWTVLLLAVVALMAAVLWLTCRSSAGPPRRRA